MKIRNVVVSVVSLSIVSTVISILTIFMCYDNIYSPHNTHSPYNQFNPNKITSLKNSENEIKNSHNTYNTYNINNTIVNKANVEEVKQYCEFDDFKLTEIQNKTIYNIVHSDTIKKENVMYTMLAIAWQESSFGLNMYNNKSGASGVFHVMPHIAKVRNERLQLIIRDEHISKILINNFEYSVDNSLAVLKYFIKVNSKKGYINWNKVYAGYYAGHDYENGAWYSKSIIKKIKRIKKSCKFS